MNLSFFIARRYLIKQKGTFSSFIIRLAIMATALSVAVMIVALAVMTGFKHAISEKLFGFMGHVQVRSFSETGSVSTGFAQPIYSDPRLSAAIKESPLVKSVAPYAVRPAIAQVNGLLEGLQLKGVDSAYRFGNGVTLFGKLVDYTSAGYSKDIVLSKTTADRLNVKQGDKVRITFIDDRTPRVRQMTVCGLYHSGMEEIDKVFAVCDLRLLQHINRWTADSINGYQVDVYNAADADSVATDIFYNLVAPPMTVYTTTGNYQFIFDWLEMQDVNSAILLIIMAIVAIINMGAALLILIVDRAVMIGLLKALGMPYRSMRNVFLSIAAIIGGSGVLAGNVLALGLCFIQQSYGILTLPENHYYMRYAPIKVIWWQVVLVDLVTLGLCVVCMWLPTLYVRRVQPAKVLQFK